MALASLGCMIEPVREWKRMLLILGVFQRTHGHCVVPPSAEPGSLFHWLARQKQAASDGRLPAVRRKRLEALGVELQRLLPADERWALQLAALRRFKREHGHFNVRRKVPELRSLAIWISNQRVEFKKGRLSKEREEKLRGLGFHLVPSEEGWEEMFAELLRFRKRHGHLAVPRWERHGLGVWVSRQRLVYSRGKLEALRVERLEAVGFSWSALDLRWVNCWKKLRDFKVRHGHCNVPHDGKNLLGYWVFKQRKAFQQGRLSREQVEKLDSLGFNWVRTWRGNGRVEGTWQRRIRDLTAFKKKHGHCRVPQTREKPRDLGSWVSAVRKSHRNGQLWPERVRELEALGFCWDYDEDVWNERFTDLVAYRERHGHCNVRQDDPDRRLASFVMNARREKREQTLSVERIERLQALGFVWNVTERRGDNRVAELRAFQKEHGHCKVPRTPEYKGLVFFTTNARIEKRRGVIDPAREAELNELGFEWEPHAEEWEGFFKDLAAFRALHGHCDVPCKGAFGRSLWAWVGRQRQLHRQGRLEGERARRLEELGVNWVASERRRDAEAWEKQLAALKDYHQQHGSFDVPPGWVRNPQLRRWLHAQCSMRKAGRIQADRARRLEAIGFHWQIPDRQDLWETHYAALVNYHREHGHCRVTFAVPNKALAAWVKRQRRRRAVLAEDRRVLLEALNFEWLDSRDDVARAA